jgi:hypothetical protein
LHPKWQCFSKPLHIKVVIHVCYNQERLALHCKILIAQILAIAKNIASTLAPIVLDCVLNQHHGYWLLNDTLPNVINLCVKLVSERFELKI